MRNGRYQQIFLYATYIVKDGYITYIPPEQDGYPTMAFVRKLDQNIRDCLLMFKKAGKWVKHPDMYNLDEKYLRGLNRYIMYKGKDFILPDAEYKRQRCVRMLCG